jgi:glycosyltransferase involved in cell wall biosynthesis
MATPAYRAVFASASTLGRFGTGGPAGRVAAVLRQRFPPSRVYCRGADAADRGADVRILPRAAWRRALARTRFYRLQLRNPEDERREFDRAVARELPAADLTVVENSCSRATLRTARAHGSRTLLLAHNFHLRDHRAESEVERARWEGPPSFPSEEMVRDTDDELSMADRIVCFSEAVRASLVRHGVEAGRIVRARLGVDGERFHPRLRSHAGGFEVGFVGFLDYYKGYPYLVEGFRQAAIPGSRLILHGGTDVRFHHALVARLAGEAAVSIVNGPVEPTYGRIAVAVLPSVCEAYGQVVLEAMACGIPVIVTRSSGAAADVTDGVEGFVVPSRDPGAIAERLRELHDDPALRERMGAAGRERAAGLSWAAFHEDIGTIVEASLRAARG